MYGGVWLIYDTDQICDDTNQAMGYALVGVTRGIGQLLVSSFVIQYVTHKKEDLRLFLSFFFSKYKLVAFSCFL